LQNAPTHTTAIARVQAAVARLTGEQRDRIALLALRSDEYRAAEAAARRQAI